MDEEKLIFFASFIQPTIFIYLLSVTFTSQDTLIELRLTDNLLGDSLNPIFSSVEFQALTNLRLLDLSGNKIKAIEEGILKGCTKLDVSLNRIIKVAVCTMITRLLLFRLHAY